MSTAGGPLPSAPAGWYDDPEMAHTLRYWDGHTWTDHRSPRTAPAAAPVDESPARVSNTWAWVVALSPLVLLLLAVAAPDTPQIATLGTALVAIVAAIADANVVARTVKMGSGAGLMAFLLPPLYLVLRTVRVRSTPWIPITWVASLVLVLVIANTATL